MRFRGLKIMICIVLRLNILTPWVFSQTTKDSEKVNLHLQESVASQNIKQDYQSSIEAGNLDHAWDKLEGYERGYPSDELIMDGNCYYSLSSWVENRRLELLKEKTPFLKREGILAELKQSLKKNLTLLEDYSLRNEDPKTAESEAKRRWSEEFDRISRSKSLSPTVRAKEEYIQSQLDQWRQSLDHLSNDISSHLAFYSTIGSPLELAELYAGFAQMLSQESGTCELALPYWENSLSLLQNVAKKDADSLDENLEWGAKGSLKKLLNCYSILGMDEKAEAMLSKKIPKNDSGVNYIPSYLKEALESWNRVQEAFTPKACGSEEESILPDPSWIPVNGLFINEDGNFCSSNTHLETHEPVCYLMPNSAIVSSKPWILGNHVLIVGRHANEMHVFIYDLKTGELLKKVFIGRYLDASSSYVIGGKDGSIAIINSASMANLNGIYTEAIIDPISLRVNNFCEETESISSDDVEYYREKHTKDIVNTMSFYMTDQDQSQGDADYDLDFFTSDEDREIMTRLALRYLRESDFDIKRKAAYFLEKGGDQWKSKFPQMIPVLLSALKDSDENTNKHIISFIKTAPEIAHPIILHALENSDPKIRANACEILGKLQWDPSLTLPALTQSLADDNFGVKISAAQALVALHQKNPKIKSIAFEAMNSDDAKLRLKGLMALSNLVAAANDEEVQTRVIQVLRDEELENRQVALEMLSQSSSPAALEAIHGATQDLNNKVVEQASMVLSNIGEPSIPFWVQDLEDPNEDRHISSIQDLFDFYNLRKNTQKLDQPAFIKAIPALTRALRDSDSQVRYFACQSLGLMKHGAAEAAPDITALLNDKNNEVRWVAAKGLSELGVSSPSIIESLIYHLNDKYSGSSPVASALGTLADGNDSAISALEQFYQDHLDIIPVGLALAGPKGIRKLEKQIQKESNEDRKSALLEALGSAKAADAHLVVSILEQELDHIHERLPNSVLESLAGLGPSASGLIPKLVNRDDIDNDQLAKTLSQMGQKGAVALLQVMNQRSQYDTMSPYLYNLGADGLIVKEELWKLYLNHEGESATEAAIALVNVASKIPQEKEGILQKFKKEAFKNRDPKRRKMALEAIEGISTRENSSQITNSIFYDAFMDDEDERVQGVALQALVRNSNPEYFTAPQIKTLVQKFSDVKSWPYKKDMFNLFFKLSPKLTPYTKNFTTMIDGEMDDQTRYYLRRLIQKINYPEE